MYKAISFFDLDNTLLNEHTKLDDSVADAMHQLRQNNVLPVISTGRNLFEIPTILAKSGIDSVVSANGSYVVFEGQPVYDAQLDPQKIHELVSLAESLDDAITVMNYQEARINFLTEDVKNNYASINTPVPPIGVDDFIETKPIQMMIINTRGKDEKYFDRFDDTFTFYRNTPFSMDVIIKNGSKKQGILQLLKKANLMGIPTYAFGDGNNDIPMLDLVDHPIAMGNALDHVKPHAEFITTNNTDNGIINGLKHFNLL